MEMVSRRPWGTNLHVTSTDTFVWSLEPELVFEERDARDACIPRFGGVWHWYFVRRLTVEGVDHSAVMVRTSHDLKVWSDAKPVYVDYKQIVKHSRLESPAICRQGDTYWLFVRDRQRETPATPAPVVVYASSAPCHFVFDEEPLAIIMPEPSTTLPCAGTDGDYRDQRRHVDPQVHGPDRQGP
jgi:hypothetical protein